MTYMQVPHVAMGPLGATIVGIAGDVDDSHGGARTCDGLDAADHGRLIAAVEGYTAGWDGPLRTLVDNLTRTGEVAGEIGRLVGDTDAQLATGLAP